MSSRVIRCTKCNNPLPNDSLNAQQFTACPACSVPIRALVYPALFKRPDASTGEKIVQEDEAGCFFHPKKKAVVSCDMCGRFLCSLCEIEFAGRHVCSSCLEAGRKKRKIRNLENSRVMYDSIALYLTVIPMLFVWPTIITAPAGMYYAIRHWKSPTSIIPRTKVRFIVALVIAGLQVTAWTLIIANSLI